MQAAASRPTKTRSITPRTRARSSRFCWLGETSSGPGLSIWRRRPSRRRRQWLASSTRSAPLAHAVAADVHAAERDAATALGLTRGLEASRYADLAQAIAGCSCARRGPRASAATSSAEHPRDRIGRVPACLRPDGAPQTRPAGRRREGPERPQVCVRGLQTVGRHRAGKSARSQSPPSMAPGRLADATRETEVLALLGEGCTNADIARRLVIASSTAKVHVRRVRRKLGATQPR